MDTIQEGRKLLRDAQAELRELIQKALGEQHYLAVKVLADFADGVAKLLQANGVAAAVAESPSRDTRPGDAGAAAVSDVRSAWQERSRTTKTKYPRFDRDNDRLVKVGWSKKSKKEYEHRVPKEAVISFVRHLGQSVSAGKLFDVEGLLPVLDASGNEVPAYQVYVTIAWLRDVGVLDKKGRDGYLLRDESVLNGSIDPLWSSLSTRSG